MMRCVKSKHAMGALASVTVRSRSAPEPRSLKDGMHTHDLMRFTPWQTLSLNNNQISDHGMIKFSEALGKGAMASVTVRTSPPLEPGSLKVGMHTHRPVRFAQTLIGI